MEIDGTNQDLENIHAYLTKNRRRFPLDARRPASNLITQIPNLKEYVRPEWATDDRQALPGMINRQLAMFAKAMASAQQGE